MELPAKQVNNWTVTEPNENRKKAISALKELKSKRVGKKYELKKINEHPPTWIEVEIKD